MINDLDDFLLRTRYPNIINRDVVKDLLPITVSILDGDHEWESIFDCIFRYILCLKTDHLGLHNKEKINFKPRVSSCDVRSVMAKNYIFNY